MWQTFWDTLVTIIPGSFMGTCHRISPWRIWTLTPADGWQETTSCAVPNSLTGGLSVHTHTHAALVTHQAEQSAAGVSCLWPETAYVMLMCAPKTFFGFRSVLCCFVLFPLLFPSSFLLFHVEMCIKSDSSLSGNKTNPCTYPEFLINVTVTSFNKCTSECISGGCTAKC